MLAVTKAPSLARASLRRKVWSRGTLGAGATSATAGSTIGAAVRNYQHDHDSLNDHDTDRDFQVSRLSASAPGPIAPSPYGSM
jgi:hypothetical protein